MERAERRRADIGRGGRVRRFTWAGVAAALAILSRHHTGRVLPDEDLAQVGGRDGRVARP